jgi:aminoglycoside phosphotransferase (APT) family kinase protein
MMTGTSYTIEVLKPHRFDEARLHGYLREHLEGFGDDLEVRQFQGGQSNPTFLLTSEGQHYVLRKKPPGLLLPKAHQVEREHRIMHALRNSKIPVPRMQVMCEDTAVIGTAFLVMQYVPGRVIADPALPDFEPSDRRQIYQALASTLASLHQVDWRAAGLTGFGRAEGYFARQIKTWSGQYLASKTGDLPTMDKLIQWLGTHLPMDEKATIVHGDFRVGNTILDPHQPRIAALLDWELSTLGQPLADLGYLCMPYHLPANVPGVRGLQGLDLEELGLPSQTELIARYCAASGREEVRDITFYIAFALFRLTAILQGVYARALQGNASDANARAAGKRTSLMAQAGWEITAQA